MIALATRSAYPPLCPPRPPIQEANGDWLSGDDGQDSSAAFQATMTKGVGTPLWMAPELFLGGTKHGPEVDLYSFGVILWELAAGHLLVSCGVGLSLVQTEPHWRIR